MVALGMIIKPQLSFISSMYIYLLQTKDGHGGVQTFAALQVENGVISEFLLARFWCTVLGDGAVQTVLYQGSYPRHTDTMVSLPNDSYKPGTNTVIVSSLFESE